MPTTCRDRIYENAGNPALVGLVAPTVARVLDVGCGAGDNARLLKEAHPHAEVWGITVSEAEAVAARAHMRGCWVADVERDPLEFLEGERFDVMVLSHVLEHLAEPARTLGRLVRFVAPGGQVLIAVPNVLFWSYRARMLAGRFDYEEAGILDRTHLRFFTVDSAPRELVAPVPDLELLRVRAEGSVPLWLLRRHVLPARWSRRIDRWGTDQWPGLFAGQILLECRKR